MKVNFNKQELLDMDLPGEALEDKVIDTSRWSTFHEIIFKKDDKFYQTVYSIGSTESQDESPWEYDDTIVCTQVEKRKVEVEKWMPIEN